MFTLVKQWNIPTDTASVAKFSPNGLLLAIIQDLTILIYSTQQQDFKLVSQMATSHISPISDLVWSPDGQCIATASDDYSIEIIHWKYGHLHQLVGHTAPVTNLIYNPRGNLLYSSSMDESIKVWDVLNGSISKTISAHSESVISISLSPGDPTILCSGSFDGLIRIFDSQTGHCLKTLTYDKDWKRENDGVIPIVKVEVAYNGKYILVKSLDGVIKLWDCVRGNVIRVFATTKSDDDENTNAWKKCLTDCRLFYPKDPNKDPLVINGDDTGNVYYWNCNKPMAPQILTSHSESPIISIDTNTEFNLISILSVDGTCSIWKYPL